MSNIFTPCPWQKVIAIIILIFVNTSAFSQSGEKWSVGGNTVNGSSFIGTLNNYPLVFKINNVQQMTLTPEGFLGLGTSSPTLMLDVIGDGKINNFNVLTNLTVGSTLSVLKVFSPTGTVDFDGSNIVTSASFTGDHIYFTGPKKHIMSSTGTVDFDANNLATSAMFTGSSIYFTGFNKHITSSTGTVDFDDNNLVTIATVKAKGFISTNFSNNGNGLILFDNTGQFQKLEFNNDLNTYLRGDGTFGSLSGTSTWDTIYANAIIGGYVNATKSIQLDGSITAGSRGAGTIGQYSIVVGGPEPEYGYSTSPIASGKYSVSFGTANESSNLGSMSFGGGNISSGLFSFAIGGNNISSGSLSVAIGSDNNASGSNSTVIGKGNSVMGKQSSILGGTGNTLTIDAINSAIIGGTGITGTLPNTVYVPNLFSNGNVGIGVENPVERLDVMGNANIRGYLYVQDGVIIGKRIDGQRVTSDTIDVKKLAIKYATTDSLLSLKLETEKMAVSKDINVGERGKFGNNIVIDGPNRSISATNSTLYFQGTNVYNDMGFYAEKFSTQNGSVIIDGANGKITSTGSINAESFTANTMNISNVIVDSSVVNSMQVVDQLKIGTGTLYLASSVNDIGGVENSIYTDNGPMMLQCISTLNQNTILNFSNHGLVGIGTNNPTAKLDIDGTFRLRDANVQNGYILTSDANGNASWQPNQMIFDPASGSLTLGNGTPVILPNTNFQIGDGRGLVVQDGILSSVWSNTDNAIFCGTDKNVGIGTNNPQKTLHIKSVYSGSVVPPEGVPGSMRLENVVTGGTSSSWDFEPMAGNTGFHNSLLIKASTSSQPILSLMEGSGNVGIGTNVPSEKLEVNGGIKLGNTTLLNNGTIKFDGSHFMGYANGNWQKFEGFWDNNSSDENVFRIDGNIGIGTNNPQKKLHVKTTHGSEVADNGNGISGSFRLENTVIGGSTSTWDFEPYASAIGGFVNRLTIGLPNVPILTINQQERVGVGTINPTEKLEIAGGIKIGLAINSGEGTLQYTSANGLQFHDAAGWKSLNSKWNQAANDPNNIFFSDGNVGIGTDHPFTNLHIHSTSSNGGLLLTGAPSYMTIMSGTDIFHLGIANLGFVQNNQNFYLNNADGPSAKFILLNWDKFGFGTETPSEKFELGGGSNFSLKGASDDIPGSILFKSNSGSPKAKIWYTGNISTCGGGTTNTVSLSADPNMFNAKLEVNSIGNVSIYTNQGVRNIYLKSNGEINARKVIVNAGLTWCDYVFAEDFELKSLSEVESFIKANCHLPEVPSEEQILKDGIDLGEISKIQMKKIEELTLYVIELQKQIDLLNKKINVQDAK